MSVGLLDAIVTGHRVPVHPLYKVISVVSLIVAAAFAVPAAYFGYLGVNPPASRPGDVDLGGEAGFVLGTVAACFSLAALAPGLLVPALWRRGQTVASTTLAAFAPPIWAITIGAAALFLGLISIP